MLGNMKLIYHFEHNISLFRFALTFKLYILLRISLKSSHVFIFRIWPFVMHLRRDVKKFSWKSKDGKKIFGRSLTRTRTELKEKLSSKQEQI